MLYLHPCTSHLQANIPSPIGCDNLENSPEHGVEGLPTTTLCTWKEPPTSGRTIETLLFICQTLFSVYSCLRLPCPDYVEVVLALRWFGVSQMHFLATLGCLEPHPLQAFTKCSQCGGALLAELAEVRRSCRVYGWVWHGYPKDEIKIAVPNNRVNRVRLLLFLSCSFREMTIVVEMLQSLLMQNSLALQFLWLGKLFWKGNERCVDCWPVNAHAACFFRRTCLRYDR